MSIPVCSPTAARAAEVADLRPLSFEEIRGFEGDNHLAAFRTFLVSCRRMADGAKLLRPGLGQASDLRAACLGALSADISTGQQARLWFEKFFQPFRVVPKEGGAGFLTGYYEPEVDGSLERSAAFSAPVLARPSDLVDEPIVSLGQSFESARRGGDGMLTPYPARSEIQSDTSRYAPLLWLRDEIEVFMVQVQGSARVKLQDGRTVRLVYAGRNGRPYTSIGRILVQEGHVALTELTLDRLKEWVRTAGQDPGDDGRTLMERNESYVFFRAVESSDHVSGPVGGEGVALTAGRSLAVDRRLWPYGLPIWISGPFADEKGEGSFHRLMTAQDTGSAIVGPARGDIFFGHGDAAGQRAAMVRHAAEFIVLLPVGTGSPP